MSVPIFNSQNQKQGIVPFPMLQWHLTGRAGFRVAPFNGDISEESYDTIELFFLPPTVHVT